MAISEKKMQIVMNNYFKAECTVNTSIREAFEKGFRIGVQKGYDVTKEPERTAKVRDKKDDPMVGECYHGRCLDCGKEVLRQYQYCPRCGARLEWE